MRKMIIAAAALLAAMAFVSCDKYEDGRPSKDVRSEFARMYPDAFDVEWEWDGMNWDVSFETGKRPNGTEKEAWFDKAGNWLRTDTDMMLSAVPQNIKDYLAADPTYGTAQIADNEVDFIETPSGSFYRFELSVEGRRVEVDVNVNGEVTFAKYDF